MAIVEEGFSSYLFTHCTEEARYNWRISREARAGSLSFRACSWLDQWHVLLYVFTYIVFVFLTSPSDAILSWIASDLCYFCSEKVREWLQSIGLGDHTTVVCDEDEPDDGAVPICNDDSVKNRWSEVHFCFEKEKLLLPI